MQLHQNEVKRLQGLQKSMKANANRRERVPDNVGLADRALKLLEEPERKNQYQPAGEVSEEGDSSFRERQCIAGSDPNDIN